MKRDEGREEKREMVSNSVITLPPPTFNTAPGPSLNTLFVMQTYLLTLVTEALLTEGEQVSLLVSKEVHGICRLLGVFLFHFTCDRVLESDDEVYL